MATAELRPHPPSARAAPSKRTKLTSVAQLRDALRLGCDPDVVEITISECPAPDTISGDLVLRVLSLPAVGASLRVLDLSFNELTDAFWTHTEWRKAACWPALTTINLANNRFTEASLSSIRDVLLRCPVLKHVDLSINSMGYDLVGAPHQLDMMTLVAPPSPALESLELSCLHLRDAHVDALLKCTPLTRSLRCLHLRSNDLTDVAAAALADALSSHKMAALRVLSLAGNAVGDSGLGALAFAIEDAASLETLDVEENQISDAGLQTLFHAVNGLHTPFTLRFLHVSRNRGNRNRQLVDVIQLKLQEKILETLVTCQTQGATRSLALSGKQLKTKVLLSALLTDHYASVVLTSIRNCEATWTTLEELDLSGNAIATDGAREVGAFLSLLPPTLRLLNLSSNRINDDGVAGLADGVEWNVTLQELNLNHNAITDDGAKRLYLKAFTSNLQRRILLSEGNPLTSECKVTVTAISQAYDLRKRFAKEFAHLERLDFMGQRLRQYGAAAIAECLVSIPSVKCTSLDLSSNMLGDEGAVEAAKLLRRYAPLARLDLSFNDIGDSGALALADALRANATLTALSLHTSIAGSTTAKPKLTETGLVAIAQALERHRALTSLDLRDNVLSPGLVPVLVQTLQRNPRIHKFNGSSAAVFLSRNEP